MREICALRRDEFSIAAMTAAVVVVVGVEQGIILAIVLSLVLHVRRHYTPHDAVVTWDAAGTSALVDRRPGRAHRAGPRRLPVRASASSTRTPSGCQRGGARARRRCRPAALARPRSRTAIDDVDYTGGKTLLELVETLEKRGIVFAIAEATDQVRKELRRFGVLDHVAPEHVFETADAARAAFRAARPGR